jgi:Uma2 family endonuclease
MPSALPPGVMAAEDAVGRRRKATYADVLAAPRHMIAEVLDGQLRLQPRPAGPHANAASVLNELLGPPFRRGVGGPGGWILLFEPELHLNEDILVPDLAGWRRTTMDHVADVAYFETRPDWVCEILSPSTAKLDRTRKLDLYAQAGVGHAWLVDPRLRTLEIYRRELDASEAIGWRLVATHSDDQRIPAEPFEAIELELAALWADLEPASGAAESQPADQQR